MSDQLLEFLEENKLLDTCQFAYKRNASTQTCIIRMLDDVRRAADQRMVTISIFFDFSKAFDRVQHNILINMLRELGLSQTALHWMASYLSDRTQAVYDRLKNKTSSFTRVGAGVPQGSVLGPLLFTLYVSGMGNVLHHCKYNFYADDLQIFLHCKPSNLQNGIFEINDDIKSIVDWANGCELMLNPSKTQAIIFGSARYINAIGLDGLPPIEIDGSTVNFSTNVKYLGVTLTNTLSWDKHVATVVKSIRTKLYQLKISKHLLPKNLRLRLITSLIFPQADYCCVALTDITGQLNSQLYKAINACIRFALDVKRDEHMTPFYRELRWLKIETRRTYFMGCLLFRIINTRQPDLLYKSITYRNAKTSRTTRASEDLLSLPLCRTEIYRRSFVFSASKLWNNLPPHVRSAQSINIFKARLYEYLFDSFL